MAGPTHRRRAGRLGLPGRRGRQASRSRSDQVADNLRPGSILRASLSTYRHEFGRVAISALVVFGALGAIDVEAQVAFDQGWGLGVAKLAFAFVLVTLGAAGSVFYPGLLDRIVGVEHGHNDRQSISTVLRTLPYGRLIVAEVVLFTATTIGLALFFVPGLVAFTLFGLVGPVITIEHRGAISAFIRSARLVRPHFWLVFVLVTLPIGLERVIEEQIHHLVANQPFLVRFASHGLIGVIIGSVVGLVEVHLAFRLSGRYQEGLPVSRRRGEESSAAS